MHNFTTHKFTTHKFTTHRFTTHRLVHSKLEESDRNDFTALLTIPKVLQFCFDMPSKDEINTQFKSRLLDWNPCSEHWLCLKVQQKQSLEFIGITGLIKKKTHFEVGFMFLPAYFGLGYATESLLGLKEYAKSLSVNALIARISEGNTASQRVVEKCGFRFAKVKKNAIKINGKQLSDMEYKIRL